MGKINDRMEGRNQGLVFALDLVRKGGVEALEKEVAARNISGLSMTMTQKEVEKNVRMMQFRSTTMGMAISFITLLDEFGMSKYQVKKFKDTFDKKIDEILAKDGDTTELVERIENEIDIRLTFD